MTDSDIQRPDDAYHPKGEPTNRALNCLGIQRIVDAYQPTVDEARKAAETAKEHLQLTEMLDIDQFFRAVINNDLMHGVYTANASAQLYYDEKQQPALEVLAGPEPTICVLEIEYFPDHTQTAEYALMNVVKPKDGIRINAEHLLKYRDFIDEQNIAFVCISSEFSVQEGDLLAKQYARLCNHPTTTMTETLRHSLYEISRGNIGPFRPETNTEKEDRELWNLEH